MAGQRARRFSELPPEFDCEEGPARQKPKISDIQGINKQQLGMTRCTLLRQIGTLGTLPISILAEGLRPIREGNGLPTS